MFDNFVVLVLNGLMIGDYHFSKISFIRIPLIRELIVLTRNSWKKNSKCDLEISCSEYTQNNIFLINQGSKKPFSVDFENDSIGF